jgi:uncharacterized NAD-dependent epimerase/dehydratase family protein
MDGSAVILTNGMLDDWHAKTAHALIRGTDRYRLLGVIDEKQAGRDAGEVLDGVRRDIPVFADLDTMEAQRTEKPAFLIIGVATSGGVFPDGFLHVIHAAVKRGYSIVNGLHDLLCEREDIAAAAKESGAALIDIRKPKAFRDLKFWTGAIFEAEAPRIAILGSDCAVGKRTTCRLLQNACRDAGINAGMIYTGQTGWMLGLKYGFILDATPNDFVSGELEDAIIRCWRETRPDVILIEGQSSLRNPSGPCGSELLLSAQSKGVILQYAPLRTCFEGQEDQPVKVSVPDPEDEIRLIREYGAETLAVTLNPGGRGGNTMPEPERRQYQRDLEKRLDIPVLLPLDEPLDRLAETVRRFINQEHGA